MHLARSEQLVMVSTTHRRDLLWAMEEGVALRRDHRGDRRNARRRNQRRAIRRLSLAAAESGTLALLLRTEPPGDASTAATRWVVGADLRSFPAHRALLRSLSATAAARPEHGFSNGVAAMGNSSSQRMLSLWLRRLSTDSIVRSRKRENIRAAGSHRQTRQCRKFLRP